MNTLKCNVSLPVSNIIASIHTTLPNVKSIANLVVSYKVRDPITCTYVSGTIDPEFILPVSGESGSGEGGDTLSSVQVTDNTIKFFIDSDLIDVTIV